MILEHVMLVLAAGAAGLIAARRARSGIPTSSPQIVAHVYRTLLQVSERKGEGGRRMCADERSARQGA